MSENEQDYVDLHTFTSCGGSYRNTKRRLQLSGQTWLFSCAGRLKSEWRHPFIQFVAHKKDADCPLCAAIKAMLAMRRERSEEQQRIKKFFELAENE